MKIKSNVKAGTPGDDIIIKGGGLDGVPNGSTFVPRAVRALPLKLFSKRRFEGKLRATSKPVTVMTSSSKADD